jgi:hypothetical protein
LKKDTCPDGDNSPSYYDGECEDDEYHIPSNDGRDGSLNHPNNVQNE